MPRSSEDESGENSKLNRRNLATHAAKVEKGGGGGGGGVKERERVFYPLVEDRERERERAVDDTWRDVDLSGSVAAARGLAHTQTHKQANTPTSK